MQPAEAHRLIQRFHAVQGAFYTGGQDSPLRALLSEEVTWSVPGTSAIAGVYEGIEAVMAYFSHRRELASATVRMHPKDMLVGEGDHVAVLTDGSALIAGEERRWSTVGLYRFRGDLIEACWLLPLDQSVFDEIWSRQR